MFTSLLYSPVKLVSQMGSVRGQHPEIMREVCSWVKEATSKPVWAKMTPNTTDIAAAAAAALEGGATGIGLLFS